MMYMATTNAMTPTLSQLKFKFAREKSGNIPSNCPIDAPDGATKKYDVLGIYPSYKILSWGFRDDKEFDWKTYWESQCSDAKKGSLKIDTNQIVSDLDKMAKTELGDLTTGAETLLGLIGQKSIRDVRVARATGNKAMETEKLTLVANIFNTLDDFSKYIKNGNIAGGKKNGYPDSKYGDKACDGDKEENCNDSLSRVFLGMGRMSVAAIDSGFSKENIDPSLVKKGKGGKDLSGSDIIADANNLYKVNAEKIYRCINTAKDDSLERDQCIEMLKDIAVAGIRNNNDRVVSDAIENLGSYYDPVIDNGKVVDLKNVATWVNSTVWLGDGLIESIEMEHDGIIGKDNPNVTKLIDMIEKQKVENTEEFSTADWITQQVLILTAAKKKFEHHPEIIEKINENRLQIWNDWIKHYLGDTNFETCSDEAKDCHSPGQSKALAQISTSITGGCLLPIITKKDSSGKFVEPSGIDATSVGTCADALSTIIKKSGNEEVLSNALEGWFAFAQDDGGIHYNKEVAGKINDAINTRFTSTFIGSIKDAMRTSQATIGGVLHDRYFARILKGRVFQPPKKGSTTATGSNYVFDVAYEKPSKTVIAREAGTERPVQV
jgi:hypothetical protein